MTESNESHRHAAYSYLKAVGLDPTPDAIGQLSGPFTAALEIMCKRGYSPDGSFWKIRGWKGIVQHIMDNAFRIRYHSWRASRFYPNGALDMMNFAGFYYRMGCEGDKWGELGPPDAEVAWDV
jgi:hypothetical protein